MSNDHASHAADLDTQARERLAEYGRLVDLDEDEVNPSTNTAKPGHEHTEECVNVADDYEKALKAHGRAQERLHRTHDRLEDVREHWRRLHPRPRQR